MSKLAGLDYFIKKRKYKSVNRPLAYIPAFLVGRQYECPGCEKTFVPDWLAKRPPIHPVKLREGGLWAMPVTTHTSCPSCSEDVPIKIPKGSFGEEFHFFGDEAYRNFGSQYLVNYSLVGVPKSARSELDRIVAGWKEDIVGVNGGSEIGQIHLTDMWDGVKRKETVGTENLTKADVRKLYSSLAQKLASNEAVRIYSCSVLFNKDPREFKKQLQKLKEFVALNLIMLSTREITSSGRIPRYHFEDDGKMGWLFDAFERMRLTLMFPFLTNGMPIPAPSLVKKGVPPEHTPGIELADAVCFSAARSAFNLYHSEPYDLDMVDLGEVAFVQFDKKGDVHLNRQKGFPGINA